MSEPVLHAGASAFCPHGGQVAVLAVAQSVRTGTQHIGTAHDQYAVVGCPWTPRPCVRLDWVTSALRVRAGGAALILQTSVGLCRAADGTAQGAPLIASAQARVRAT